MPTHKYAFKRGSKKRLEVSYSFGVKNIVVRLDGKELGRIATRADLEEGRSFTLPDGSTLSLSLRKKGIVSQLVVLRNGYPLPGTITDPFVPIKNAYEVLFFIGGANVLIGLGTVLFHLESLRSVSSGWFSVLFGILYLILGFAIRALSRPAMIAALLVFLVDSLFLVVAVLTQGYTLSWGSILVRVVFFVLLANGVEAIWQAGCR